MFQRIRGQLQGLQVALQAALKGLRMAGDFELADTAQLTLPHADWSVTSRVDAYDSNTIAIGALSYVAYTVPGSRRQTLYYLTVRRLTGDNTILGFQLLPPAAYATGSRQLTLLQLAAAGTEIYWPVMLTTPVLSVYHTPILLEPGTEVVVLLSGAGVAASTFRVRAGALHSALVLNAALPLS